MRKFLALFAAGFAMEMVWVLGTVSVQSRSVLLAVAMAALAPYFNAAFSAITVVDERDLARRAIRVTVYAAGCVLGVLAALLLFSE